MNDEDKSELKAIKSELDGIGCAMWVIAIIMFFTSCACVAVACTDYGIPTLFGGSPMADRVFKAFPVDGQPAKTNYCAASQVIYTDHSGSTNHSCIVYATLIYAPYADDALRIYLFSCWGGNLTEFHPFDTRFEVGVVRPDGTGTETLGIIPKGSNCLVTWIGNSFANGANHITLKLYNSKTFANSYEIPVIWNSTNTAERVIITNSFPAISP